MKVFGAGGDTGLTKFQIFEVIVPTIFAHVRPEFAWHVSANHNDGGLDFRGEQRFLDDEALGIAAAITVGGQCKKRSHVDTVLEEIAGSVLTMADRFDPTFVVVALSARLARQRVLDAQATLERQCRRHCHILDRAQIEGLIGKHLLAIDEILRAGLDPPEVEEVVRYFSDIGDPAPLLAVDTVPPSRVLAGLPFEVDVTIRSTFVSMPGARIWWAPSRRDGRVAPVTLIGPVGTETPAGVSIATTDAGDDVLLARLVLELVTYAVGPVDLGELLVGHEDDGPDDPWAQVPIGEVDVIENMRPRFYAKPFRARMAQLEQAYARTLAAGVATVGVVGAGGSGKSRLCEEFALGRRREGCRVVTAKQTKTHDDPHRILADLLFALADAHLPPDGGAGDLVIRAVSRYDPELAATVSPAIRSLFGTTELEKGQMTEQHLLSALLVLVTARARRTPVIVHLQDLHWCTTDVLKLLERLIWQLEQVVGGRRPQRSEGVLFVLEGRIRERHSGRTSQAWSSIPFETFLERLDGSIVTCGSFDAEDALAFVRLLFEDRHSAQGVVPESLLDLQWDLVRRINQSAGGNPFHSLEQVQLLKQRGVLGQNPLTGLLYTVRPEPEGAVLPDSVFVSIQMRWEYLRHHTPDLAMLLWACALLEDRIPVALFRRLRSEFAPDVSLREVDGADLLWTGDGATQEVVFRHENYFEALRRFDVAPADRSRAVEVYAGWYAGLRTPGPIDRFRWARVLLEAPDPNVARARSLLRTARQAAERQRDRALARRISAAELDLAWAEDGRSPHRLDRLLRWCDQDLALSQELLDSDRARAEQRITQLRERLADRLASGRHRGDAVPQLQRRQLTADVLQAKYLFNAQAPDLASDVAGAAVRQIRLVRASTTVDQDAWDALEMEALHTHAIALAINGELRRAIPVSDAAVQLARRRPTVRGRQVIGSHGNILLGIDPVAGVTLLREFFADGSYASTATEADRLVIHLSIGQALLAHRTASTDLESAIGLRSEARTGLTKVVGACLRLGLYPDAGAAALMLGIISVLEDDGDALSWFAQAVAASSRGQQLETLWKAHIDLAMALHQSEGTVTPTVRDQRALRSTSWRHRCPRPTRIGHPDLTSCGYRSPMPSAFSSWQTMPPGSAPSTAFRRCAGPSSTPMPASCARIVVFRSARLA